MYRVKPFKVMSYQETVRVMKYKSIMKMAEDLIVTVNSSSVLKGGRNSRPNLSLDLKQ